MASAIEQITSWCEKLEDWQADTVRRLLTQEVITEADIDDWLAMLKLKHGLVEPGVPDVKARPMKKGDVSGVPKKIAHIVLKSITNIENVNALPTGSKIYFGDKGITVVYGQNGSGKSGYARILKRACRARDSESIHPNVFGKGPWGPAKAIVNASIDGQDMPVAWEDGSEPPEALANVSVFDGKCGRVIVDENNEAVYLPYGSQVFAGLVEILKVIREKLTKERPVIAPVSFLDIPPATWAGRFLGALSGKSTLEGVTWSSEDETTLKKLEVQVVKAEAEDPEKESQRLRNLQERVELLSKQMQLVDSILAESREQHIREDVAIFAATKKALAIARKEFESLKSELLPGFGEDPWQQLYQAAENYAVQAAYPEKDFPNLEDGARCVLCQQTFSTDAAKVRMKRFKDYMKQTAKKAHEAAEQAIAGHYETLSALKLDVLENFKDVIDELESRRLGARQELDVYMNGMSARCRELLEVCRKCELTQISPAIRSPNGTIQNIVTIIQGEAEKVKKNAVPEELARLRSARDELQSKKILLERRGVIEKQIKQMNLAGKYDRCLRDTDSRAITLEGRRIVSQSLTPQLVHTLKEELKQLGAAHIPLNLRPSGVEGETRHKMELEGSRFPGKVNLSDILSEGEQRVVGIAGFLAELQLGGHKCPVVFDDPVCSLDHLYRGKIALRLAKEAKQRQVIVFTHDIAFMMDLEERVGELEDGSFVAQTVSRHANVVGQVAAGVDWHAMSCKDRVDYIENTVLPEARKLHDKSSPAQSNEYNLKAAILYDMLRECWEAFIEDILLAATVRRHRNSVETTRLRRVAVDTHDYVLVERAMSKCSKWMRGHDKSEALSVERPAPEEIAADLQELRKAVKETDKRNEETAKTRRKAIEPSKPNIG